MLLYRRKYQYFIEETLKSKRMRRKVIENSSSLNLKGRKIVTQVSRNAGDMIIQSSPFCSVVSQDKLALTCSNCFVTQEYCSQKLLRCAGVICTINIHPNTISVKVSTTAATLVNEQIGSFQQQPQVLLAVTNLNVKVFKRLHLINQHKQYD